MQLIYFPELLIFSVILEYVHAFSPSQHKFKSSVAVEVAFANIHEQQFPLLPYCEISDLTRYSRVLFFIESRLSQMLTPIIHSFKLVSNVWSKLFIK
jgi:hypothetical protein